MTRKKQGAPQRLNAHNEARIDDQSIDHDCNEDVESNAAKLTDKSLNNSLQQTDTATTKADQHQKEKLELSDVKVLPSKNQDMDSSCQKLLAFTKNFLTKDVAYNTVQNTSTVNHQTVHGCSAPSSPSTKNSSQPSVSRFISTNKKEKSFSSRPRDMADGTRSDSPITGCNTSFDNTSFPAENRYDELPALSDISTINAAHKFIMDAMVRQQKHLFEQCTSNWMSVQRSDNNCLSKSKAERYRWCVQGSDGQNKPSRSSTSSNSHVSNLKKSASMAGVGVTPVQDKLYSTVFTGASKFCCRDCGNPFNTLVELTVHMNKTGHFRDANGTEKSNSSDDGHHGNSAKKRSILDEDNQSEKVLSCMGCGDMFESLQDLSVHMMKTKHYEFVPSLRMWKQDSHAENLPPPKKRLQVAPTYGKKPEVSTSSVPEVNIQNRSPLYPPTMLSGITNPAAVYSNLLYPSPWLASSAASPALPSLLAGANGLSYPFGYFPGIFPGSVLSSPAAALSEKKDIQLNCSQCKESFTTVQKLTEHYQETSHFPALDAQWLNLLSGLVLSASSQSSISSTSTSEKYTSTQAFSNFSNSGLKTAGNLSTSRKRNANVLSSQNDGSLGYIQSCHKDDKEKKNSFDFIKSLESTIQSAISKVKSPHDDKSHFRKTNSNNYDISDRHRFSPFVSSIKGDNMAFSDRNRCAHLSSTTPQSCEMSAVSRGKSNKDDQVKIPGRSLDKNHDKLASDNSVAEEKSAKLSTVKAKGEKPLDLTVKRDITSADSQWSDLRANAIGQVNQKNVCSPGSSCATKTSTGLFSSCNGKSPSENPLQSLESLFALMKPKVSSATSEPSHIPQNSFSKSLLSSKPYQPLMLTNDSNSQSSNPLQEILKIVNKTNIEKTMKSENNSRNLYINRKRSSGDSSPIDPKNSKLSILLHDLVVPKDESKSNENPLQMMQDLVDKKLNPPHRISQQNKSVQQNPPFNKHSTFSSKPPTNNDIKIATSSSLSSNSSLVQEHHHKLETNGVCKSIVESGASSRKCASPRCQSSTDCVNSTNLLPELTLEIAFAGLVASSSSSAQPDDSLIDKLSSRTGLTLIEVKDWFKNTHDALQSRGELPFVRCHDNDKNSKDFICTRCGAVFTCAQKFSLHLEEHIVQFGSKHHNIQSADFGDKIDHCSSPRDVKNGKASPKSGKFTIQGSLCFGSYSPENGASHYHDASSPRSDEEESTNALVVDDVIRVKQLPHLHRSHCPDQVESPDDVITVTS